MKTFRNFLLILIIIVIAYGSGYRTGSSKIGKAASVIERENSASPKYPSIDFRMFWDVWDRVSSDYLDKKSIDSQKMYYGAISGMVASLGDPYTVFLPPDQNKEAKEDLGGKFEGIGAQLGIKDNRIVVIAPLKSSPAEKAGLKPEDWIVKVDGKETLNWTLPEAVSNVRGPKGSTVKLTIYRKDALEPEEVNVIRDEIKVASVEWEEKYINCEGDPAVCKEEPIDCSTCKIVAHLKLGRFGDQTNDEWNKVVAEISSKYFRPNASYAEGKFRGIVFDLRNNPGGYLSGSVFIASEFIKDGNVVIQENADGSRIESKVTRKGKLIDVPMVIVINKGSASASEIVAGALKVRNKTPVIGESSFGKGTIQEAQDLDFGAGIHITTAKWLLPDGSWINGQGVKPDIEIKNDYTDPKSDLQLQRAYGRLIEGK